MAATPQLIKELRELTGAGMMDCKNALNETGGDLEKAVQALREAGLGKAAKKAGNVAAEGLIAIEVNSDKTKAVILELNSQTDFVAKNENFINITKEITAHAFSNNINETIEKMIKNDIHKINYLVKNSKYQIINFDYEDEFLNINEKKEYEKALNIIK